MYIYTHIFIEFSIAWGSVPLPPTLIKDLLYIQFQRPLNLLNLFIVSLGTQFLSQILSETYEITDIKYGNEENVHLGIF